MRVPLSWLAEFVDLAPGATAEDVHASLVSVGFEEEAVHRFEVTGPVVVGRVLEFAEEPQTNGKTIRWCRVRVAPEGRPAADGGDAVRGIVCGASNFEVGDDVVVTLPGSVLPGPFPISARRTYGHVSDGMIASARELGLGDEHDGILVLGSLGMTAEEGADAITLLHLDDEAVEVNVTPDRGYALSIRGIAREYAHATGGVLRDPADAVEVVPATGVDVAIRDDAPVRGRQGASRFVARVVRGVDATRPVPPWVISRLALAGIRSVSIVVDVTALVMLELGQPVHAYDLDRVTGGIVVRRAEAGERLTTLDHVERTLDPEDLVVADGSGAIGLAGVMGGLSTEVDDETHDVLVEAATFDAVSIGRTARRHRLSTEASRRFERGVDPAVAPAAAARVVQLLVELAGGSADALGAGVGTVAAADAIVLADGAAARLVGVDYTDEEVRDALVAVGCVVERADGALVVAPPSWRPDLTAPVDLIEEVARLVGYDRIPSVVPVAPPGRGLSARQRAARAAASALAGVGFTEVLAYPFVDEERARLFGAAAREAHVPTVRLANPLDRAAPVLRTSLLPGLIDVARRNLGRGMPDLAIWEAGAVFRPDAAAGPNALPSAAARPEPAALAALDAALPGQPRHVAVLAAGDVLGRRPGQPAVPAGLADALDAVRALAHALGVEVDVVQATHRALHPGRTALVRARTADGPVPIGYAGELAPALAEEHDLPRVVAVAELDLDALVAAAPDAVSTPSLSPYPAATQDLSLVVDADVPADDVRTAVIAGAGELLESVRLVDDYRGGGVPDGEKSLSFALVFRAPDRTLTAAEASEARLAGAARASEATGASVRE